MKKQAFKFFILIFIVSISKVTKGISPEIKNYYQSINGTKLFFQTKIYDTKSPYILYLHGGPGSNSSGMMALTQQIPLKHNLIFLDQRGCGKSERKVHKDFFNYDYLVKDIDEILDILKIKKVTIIGHSWGGSYGIIYSFARPNKVKKLILVSPLISIKKKIINYHSHTPKYIKKIVNLFKTLRNNKKISNNDIFELKRFLSSTFKHLKKKKKHIYHHYDISKNKSSIKSISNESIDIIIYNLEKDYKYISSLPIELRTWQEYKKSNLRKKYPLLDYRVKRSVFRDNIMNDAKKLYSFSEIKFSRSANANILRNIISTNLDLMNKIVKLKMPIFYLYGKYDILHNSEELKKHIKSKFGKDNIIEFKYSGHRPNLEVPHEYISTLQKIIGNNF